VQNCITSFQGGKDLHEVSTNLEVSLWLVRLEIIGLIKGPEGIRERKVMGTLIVYSRNVLFGKNNGEGMHLTGNIPLTFYIRLAGRKL
jgi:hypothetical protein